MVFCYKIITDTPRRSGTLSPGKKSPTTTFCNGPTTLSELIKSINVDSNDLDVIDSIPEREWRLLSALAKRREEDDEREKLADAFRRMWQKEKEDREIVEAETNLQYRRYITNKRRNEQSWYNYQQYQKFLESQVKRRQLLDCIKDKEQRSAEILAWVGDRKTTTLLDRVLVDEARAILAADRRCRISEAEQLQKRVHLIDAMKKELDAGARRQKILRDASQRLAITNALSNWETSRIRQELFAFDSARRAAHAARAAETDARSAMLMRAREAKRRRGRRLAAVTEQLRDAIRSGRKS